MIALFALSCAASWAPGADLPEDGLVALPGGDALRLRVEPAGALVEIIDLAGADVTVWGVPEGLLLPAEPLARTLRIRPEPGAEVEIFREDGRAVLRAWEHWESAAWRDMRAGLPLDTPPSGGERLAASLNLREDALDNLGVRALGLFADISPYATISSVSHRVPGARGAPQRPTEDTTEQTMRGPGVALIETWPEPGELTRYTVIPSLDGEALPPHALASTGVAARTVRIWVPPGQHSIGVQISQPGVLTHLELAPVRPAVGMPRLAHCGDTLGLSPADAAELAYLCGDSPAAIDGYRSLLNDPNSAIATLALVRIIALDPRDHAEHLALGEARLALPTLSDTEREVLANTLLGHAGELSDEGVMKALRAARDPNPAALAMWLDDHGGQRPAGIALLELARPAIPNQDLIGNAMVLEAGLATRLTMLEPVGSPSGAIIRGERGPGIARVRVDAGQSVEITLDPTFPERMPVLRVLADAPARFTMDGLPLDSQGGPLDLALAPGVHQLSVQEGELILPDPEGVLGGVRIYERTVVPLPATWKLPDPGVPGDLRVELIGAVEPCAVLARFDTGEVRCATASMRAPASATSMTLEGSAHASVAMRALLESEREPPLSPVTDVEAALRELRELTLQVDAGDAAARLERATLLARMGSLELARQDLSMSARVPELREQTAALALRISPPRPSAPLVEGPAPRTPEAALALAGDPGPPTAEHLAELAQPGTLARAAALWLDEDPTRALEAALAAGPQGEEVVRLIEARLLWTPLTRVDRGGGLVELQVPNQPSTTLYARVRDALLAQPWPADEGLVARGELGLLSRFDGKNLNLRLFCRDERLTSQPCTVDLRVDDQRSSFTLADGETREVRLSLRPGTHELELSPGPGALALRTEVDGVLLPPTVPRLALRVTAAQPAELSVATPAALRVDCVRGEVEARIGEQRVHLVAGESGLLAATAGDAATLRVSGDGDVLLWWGIPQPVERRTPPELPEPAPPPGPDPALRDELLSRFAHPPFDVGVLPGDPASVQIGFTPRVDRIGVGNELWRSEQLSAEVLRADNRSWQRAELWVNGPDWMGQSFSQRALGAELETGLSWPDAWAGLRLGAAYGTRSQYSARSARLIGFAVRDLNLGPNAELRGSARARASLSSAPPGPVRVDPEAWNERIYDSPLEGVLGSSLLLRPARDLRVELGVQGGWRGPGGESPSALSGSLYAETNLLVGDMGCATLSAALDGGITDDLSGLSPSGPRLGAAYDHVIWAGPTRRWVVWGETTAWPTQQVAEGAIGVRLLLTPYRGVEDLPPYRELFLTHRGGP